MSETMERDCMQCEQTFTTTAAQNDDLCEKCRKPVVVQPAQPRKWQSQAGPIQSKRVREALQSLSWEGRSYTELSGVIGGEEHRHSFTLVFGGGREDVNEALSNIAEKYNYMVTRENYAQIIEECAGHLAVLVANRPVKDTRETPEQRAETIRKNQEYAERERADRAACQAAHEAAMAEQRAIAAQSQVQSAPEMRAGAGNEVRYNREHNGVEICFSEKPDRSVLNACKADGFRWSPRSHVWYKKFTPGAWTQAHYLAGIPQTPAPAQNTDPAGAYVQAQEDAQQDAISAAIGA